MRKLSPSRHLVLLSVILISAGVVWLWSRPSGEGEIVIPSPPELTGASQVYDFGYIKDDGVLRHSFTITNKESGKWRFKGIRSSCGCTTSEKIPDVIPPGGTATIPITMTAESGAGRVEQNVYLDLEDGRKITLKLRGFVVRSILPFLIQESPLRPDQPLRLEVALHPSSSGTVSVRRIESTIPAVLVGVRGGDMPKVPGRESLTAIVQLDVSSIEGRLDVPLTFHLNGSPESPLSTRVVGHVLGHVEAESTRITIGPMRPGERGERVLRLYAPRGKKFTIAGVQTSPESASELVTTPNDPVSTTPVTEASFKVTAVGEPMQKATRVRYEVIVWVDGQQRTVPVELFLLSSGPI